MNMYVYGWVAVRFVVFVWVGLVWLWVELINFAKEGRQYRCILTLRPTAKRQYIHII